MTAPPSIDLDAYFARIAYDGPRTATLETLAAVHLRHAEAIPFENIDVLLGRSIRLDLPALEQKLVRDQRGGYCFEQNTLFASVLRALGFEVTAMLARVRWQVPPETVTPQTHVALRVEIDGRSWLADAGFGSVGLLAPLDLGTTAEQHTRFEPRRLVPHGRNLLQQVRLGDTWTDVCILYTEAAHPIDFEVANWFTSTHPGSRFRQNLMAARADGDRRYSLLNRDFTVRRADGSAERHQVRNEDELRDVLRRDFRLSLPRELTLNGPNLVWD